MSNDEDLRRASRAKQLMDDPLIVEAFDTVERALVDKWMNAPVGDAEGREDCFRMLWSMRAFKAHFDGVLANGVFAAHQIERQNKEALNGTGE